MEESKHLKLPLSGTFAEWIKRWRAAKKWNQQRLAKELSISVSALQSYEQGTRRPSHETAVHMAKLAHYTSTVEEESFVRFAQTGRLLPRHRSRTHAPPVNYGILEAGSQARPEDNLPQGVQGWPILVDEQFNDNHNRWALGYVDKGIGSIHRTLLGGVLMMRLLTRHDLGVNFTGDANIAAPATFYVAVDVRMLDEPYESAVGLALEMIHGAHYLLFQIYPQLQTFAVRWIKHGGDEIEFVVPHRQSPDSIRAGGWQTLAVQAEREEFTFFINGQQVAQATIPRSPIGRLDLAIFSSRSGDEVMALYRNFCVRTPAQ